MTHACAQVQELEGLNIDAAASLRAIIDDDSAAKRALLAQGDRWAAHILEAPISWIMSATYILITVTAQATPLSLIVWAATRGGAHTGDISAISTAVTHIIGAIDAVIYVFLPIWTTCAEIYRRDKPPRCTAEMHRRDHAPTYAPTSLAGGCSG